MSRSTTSGFSRISDAKCAPNPSSSYLYKHNFASHDTGRNPAYCNCVLQIKHVDVHVLIVVSTNSIAGIKMFPPVVVSEGFSFVSSLLSSLSSFSIQAFLKT
eukprot:TRINITY_DN6077_c0_g1_i1.p1 TRINITY_DN6077_c0_g1~~TRINITY_DN6077_c0_g1_i1.p1  ORF type:complete len:102 (-),score=7.89 TRINITY_DN6077_c0_g1_i1:227-532(-)